MDMKKKYNITNYELFKEEMEKEFINFIGKKSIENLSGLTPDIINSINEIGLNEIGSLMELFFINDMNIFDIPYVYDQTVELIHDICNKLKKDNTYKLINSIKEYYDKFGIELICSSAIDDIYFKDKNIEDIYKNELNTMHTLSNQLYKLLDSNGIKTVGDLATMIYDGTLISIKGISDKRSKIIEIAFDAYCKSYLTETTETDDLEMEITDDSDDVVLIKKKDLYKIKEYAGKLCEFGDDLTAVGIYEADDEELKYLDLIETNINNIVNDVLYSHEFEINENDDKLIQNLTKRKIFHIVPFIDCEINRFSEFCGIMNINSIGDLISCLNSDINIEDLNDVIEYLNNKYSDIPNNKYSDNPISIEFLKNSINNYFISYGIDYKTLTIKTRKCDNIIYTNDGTPIFIKDIGNFIKECQCKIDRYLLCDNKHDFDHTINIKQLDKLYCNISKILSTVIENKKKFSKLLKTGNFKLKK